MEDLAQKLAALYYAPGGYAGATELASKLAQEGVKVDEDVRKQIRAWLAAQPVGGNVQTRPLPPKYAQFLVRKPNDIHQADLLHLSKDPRRKAMYALTVVDLASRYKEAEPLTNKLAKTVGVALNKIYQRGPLTWPRVMKTDAGTEFRGDFAAQLKEHSVRHDVADKDHHRSQGYVENLNKMLARRLYRFQTEKELATGRVARDWVANLRPVLDDMNATPTRTTGIAPASAVELAEVPRPAKNYAEALKQFATNFRETTKSPLDVGDKVFVALTDDELPGKRRRATDPFWTSETYTITRRLLTPGNPWLYYVEDDEGEQRGSHGYTAEQLRRVT